ncbi:hypothetical protein GUJ93_ZPchr0006g40928 [Zizania palustris]|uniref:Uncharacterized protein n=1 Tax=Zizania palustris TaxID=103762 RepID=A0A8J5VGU0_ZIZPA|nr:hypothetical protein GUJ93_ZPchr0006g40928 [Zizania palustris]
MGLEGMRGMRVGTQRGMRAAEEARLLGPHDMRGRIGRTGAARDAWEGLSKVGGCGCLYNGASGGYEAHRGRNGVASVAEAVGLRGAARTHGGHNGVMWGFRDSGGYRGLRRGDFGCGERFKTNGGFGGY